MHCQRCTSLSSPLCTTAPHILSVHRDNDVQLLTPTGIIDAVGVAHLNYKQSSQPMDLRLIVQQQQQLVISGRFFSLPIRVLVGGSVCQLPQLMLRSVDTLCLNISGAQPISQALSVSDSTPDSGRLCREFGSVITCVINDLRGVNQALVVLSGEHGAIAEVNGTQPTLSIQNPSIYALSSPQCSSNDSKPLQLTNCSNTEPLQLLVYCLDESLGDLPTSIFLEGVGSADPLICTPFIRDFDTFELLFSRCVVSPRLGHDLRLRVQQQRDLLSSQELATVSFAECLAGHRNNLQPTDSANNSTLPVSDTQPVCMPCDSGFSTRGLLGVSQCEPCMPGSVSLSPGSANCSLCEPGTYQAESASMTCVACPLNTFQPLWGSVSCPGCALDSYIVVGQSEDARPISYQCASCPPLGECAAGNITAQSGGYLLLDSTSGLVSSSRCSPSACLSASSTAAAVFDGQGGQTQSGRVKVFNRCSPGRYPAFDPTAEVLAGTEYLNILCAHCLSGYSQVNGRCIQCSSVQWGPLILVTFLLLSLVYALHRLPSALDSSASVLIGSYFLQHSSLFLSTSSTPQLYSLALFNIFGADGQRGSAYGQEGDAGDSNDFYMGFCIAPMSDWGRIGMQLLSPVIALTLLILIAGAQLISRYAVRRRIAGVGDSEGEMESNSRAAQVYRAVFYPAQWLRSTALLSVPTVDSAVVSSHPQLPVSLWLPYQRTVVRLLQLSYNVIALVSLTFFRFEEVGRFGQRLADYTTIDPDSSEYRAWMGLFFFVLLFVVCGLPGYTTMWLWRRQRSGHSIPPFRQRPDPQSVEPFNTEHPGGRRVLILECVRLQLIGMFRTSCWWMFPFLLCRRLLLVTLLVVIRNSSVWIWLSLLNSCLLAFHVSLQPYNWARDNTLETLTLLSLTLQTTLLSLYPPPISNPLIFLALNCLVMGPVLVIVVTTVRRFYSEWGKRRRRLAGQAHHDWREQLNQRLVGRYEDHKEEA